LGGTISRENCHPFAFERWLWQYNGEIEDFPKVVRDLRFDVDPQLYPYIQGDADTETCFYLALTYGLEKDVPEALGRMIGRVERAMAEREAEGVFRSTGVTTDGEALYAWRYATDDSAKTLYYTNSAEALRDASGAEIPVPRGAAIVVSEPLELEYGANWVEVPPCSLVTVRRDGDVRTEALAILA
jgi:glutamine amidotransferase